MILETMASSNIKNKVSIAVEIENKLIIDGFVSIFLSPFSDHNSLVSRNTFRFKAQALYDGQ
jgi:hypothetical protein